MNRILTILLITSAFSLPAEAKRSSGGGKETTRENATPVSGTIETTTPSAIQTIPTPTYRTTPSTRAEATPFAAPTTTPTYRTTPSTRTVATPFVAPTPTQTYTPSTPSYRGESFKGRAEQSPTQQPAQRQTTRSTNLSEPSATVQERTSIPAPTAPARSFSAESVRREESHRATSTRERNESLTQPTRTDTTPQAEPRNALSTRARKETHETSRSTATTPDANPEPTPLRTVERLQRERTARTEQQRVQITPPSRTAPRTTVNVRSPSILNEHSSPQPAPTTRVSSTRYAPPPYALTTQRHPEPVRTTYHPPDTHNYHSRQTPTHHYNSYRPVTCYSERDAFWNAFSFAMVAPLVAPLYFAQVVDPFPVRTVTTTWNSGAVAVSVSTRSTYPVYTTYRPYYCSSAWGYHDGWHHSNVYYGGWRSSWYGGFSYMFNPYPVYRTYYLYEEPQPIVIQQPAQQVVYINQPAQQVAPAQGSIGIFDTPQQPVAAPLPAETQKVANTPAPCFCACKCNGRVPCICEYACGSEFNYSPEAYTLVDFISYSESLNAELIWSSYAELDRPEATDFVAEAGD